MLADKLRSGSILLADDNALWLLQHNAQQGANTRRTCTDNQHGILLGDFRNTCCPKAGSKNIAHKKRLFIGNAVGNFVQPLVSVRHTHKFRLSAVNAAAKCPAAMMIGAIIDKALLAEEAFAAERFYVYRHAVTGLHGFYVSADRFHHAHHFMAHGNSRHNTRYRAMLNMQITGADASQRYAHNSITRRNKLRLGLFLQSKLTVFNIS